MLAYQRTLEKSFPFCCCLRAQMRQFLFKKKGEKRRRKGKCGTVMSPFFFNDKRNKGKERENLTSTIFQIFSEEDSCARVRTTCLFFLSFFFSGRGGDRNTGMSLGLLSSRTSLAAHVAPATTSASCCCLSFLVKVPRNSKKVFFSSCSTSKVIRDGILSCSFFNFPPSSMPASSCSNNNPRFSFLPHLMLSLFLSLSLS